MWDLVLPHDQASNPGPLHWEHAVLATGPPGKSLFHIISETFNGLQVLENKGGNAYLKN